MAPLTQGDAIQYVEKSKTLLEGEIHVANRKFSLNVLVLTLKTKH